MEGLGCCKAIEDYDTHHFHADSFVHNTSICIAIDMDGKVYVTNLKQQIGTLLGWGKGVPKYHNRVN